VTRPSVYISVVALEEGYQVQHQRDIINLGATAEVFDPGGGGPPTRPPHSPQMKFQCYVAGKTGNVKAEALPDSGCTGQVVSSKFVQQHRLETAVSKEPVHLRLANGKVVGVMDRMARVKSWIGDHVTEDWMWITELVGYDLIYGQPWLELHDPMTRWSERTFLFDSAHCTANCLLHGLPVRLMCDKNGYSKTETCKPAPGENICFISADAAIAMGKRDEQSVTWIFPEHWKDVEKTDDESMFAHLFAADCSSVTLEDFKKFHEKLSQPHLTLEELKAAVPKEFHEVIDAWNPKEAYSLPDHKPGIDHKIPTTPGADPPHKRAYGLGKI